MNVYYMNEKLGDNTIIVHNTRPSEYQDLIEDYLAKGGKITYCEEGEAEGALRLDRYVADMDPSYKPKSADQWEDYFDMNHLIPENRGMSGKVNKIKGVTG